MKQVQEKIETLEKILMRDLDDQEIEYLFDHSVNDFLFEVLGFDQDDLLVLLKIKKIISDWCTRPAGDINVDGDMNMFFDSGEFENEDVDINFFKDTNRRINRKVSDVLSSIIGELQAEQRKYVAREEGANVEITSDSEPPTKEFEFDENDEVGDLSECEINDDCINEIIPDGCQKWLKNVSEADIIAIVNKAITDVANDYANNEAILSGEEDVNLDELTGEVVDKIKDFVIKFIIDNLNKTGEMEFDDEEIQSEVLDYLYKHNYKVKSINNKVSLL